MRPSVEITTRAAVAAALTALVVWSFWQRWTMLTASPFPVGIDGYFYPIQVRSLLEHGTLAYPASPLTFWLMAPLAAATDPISGAKLGAALFGALIALPAYGVGAQLGKSRGAGLVAAALMTTSAGSAFLTFEFVKNGVGLTVAMTALWLALRAFERPSRPRIVAAVAGMLAALLAHKMAGAMVLVIAAPAAFAEARARGELSGMRLHLALGGLAGVALLAIVVGIVFPERFVSADDLALVGGLLTTDARWDAPALVLPRTTLAMGNEAAIGGVLALIAAVVLVYGHRRASGWRGGAQRAREPDAASEARGADEVGAIPPAVVVARELRTIGAHVASWVIVGLALFAALPWLAVTDPMGLGFRLRIAAFVPMALCAAIIAPALVGPVKPLVRDGILAVLALGIVVLMPRERTGGKIVAHPAMVASAQALAGHIPAGATVIVPERHIMFMVAWYTGAPTRLSARGVPRDQRWRVMTLAFIGDGSALDEALMAARGEPSIVPPRGTHPRHPNGLVIVPEATWEWLLAHIPPDARDYFAAWPTI